MAKIIRNLGLAAIASLALAACGGGGGSGGITSTAPPTTATAAPPFQDQFGTTFAADFNASATANATDPAAADVPALNLTAEPISN